MLGFFLPIIISGYLMLFYLMAFICYHGGLRYDYGETFMFMAIVIMPMLFAIYYPCFIQCFLYTVVMEYFNSKIKSHLLFVLISTVYGGLASFAVFYILPKVETILDSNTHLYVVGVGTGFFTGLILRRPYLKSTRKNNSLEFLTQG
ncbi:hypothetical protein DM558_05285 [Entomomonas moraniae]|uniref:Uncharacterized protein n=2 Tax=Entomomonas moraniae TaxID=2213226 RepID=A0A3Q9JID8_9GAMM|nr:hypothetical protein DM558_05285 [Entomomonas moraniae]